MCVIAMAYVRLNRLRSHDVLASISVVSTGASRLSSLAVNRLSSTASELVLYVTREECLELRNPSVTQTRCFSRNTPQETIENVASRGTASLQQKLFREASYLTRILYRKCLKSVRTLHQSRSTTLV